MRFSLTIDCDNAAFAPVNDDASEPERYQAAGDQVLRMLALWSRDYDGDDLANTRTGNLFDRNGNRCGSWSLREEDEDQPPAEDNDEAVADRLLRDYGPGDRKAIAGAIDAFDRECGEREHTDTDSAWVLLRAIRTLCAGAPAGWTHAETSTEDQPERLYRVAYYRETAPRGWTLTPDRYTLEEAGAEAQRRATRDNLAQVLRETAPRRGGWTMREEAYLNDPAWSLFDNGQRAAVGLIEADARAICEAMNRRA